MCRGRRWLWPFVSPAGVDARPCTYCPRTAWSRSERGRPVSTPALHRAPCGGEGKGSCARRPTFAHRRHGAGTRSTDLVSELARGAKGRGAASLAEASEDQSEANRGLPRLPPACVSASSCSSSKNSSNGHTAKEQARGSTQARELLGLLALPTDVPARFALSLQAC